MKKRILSLVLALVMLMALGTTAFAANEVSNDKQTVTANAAGASVSFAEGSDEKINVTYTDETNITDGNQYMVIVVKGSATDYTITESSILYIDQKEATGNSVSFDVYPSGIQDSVILITGANNGPVIAAIIDANYILGDLNSDGKINGKDVVMMNQYLAKISSLDSTAMSAADINCDGKVNGKDVVILNQYLAKIISVLG